MAKRKYSLIFFCIFLTGCIFNKSISHNEISKRMLTVEFSDGISEEEAIIIAQSFIVNEHTNKCNVDIDQINVKRPFISKQYTNSEIYMVQFPWIGYHKINRVFPVSVSINKVTGESKCIGQIVRK